MTPTGSELCLNRSSPDMEMHRTIPPLIDALTESVSSASSKTSLESFPIDPQLLGDLSIGDCHNNNQHNHDTMDNNSRFDEVSAPNLKITEVRGCEITDSPQDIQMVPDQPDVAQPAESIAVASISAQTPTHVDMDSFENTSATFSESPSAGPITRAKARVRNSCTQSHSCLLSAPSRRARPYSPEEDRFLRQLMRRYISWEMAYSAFQRRFSDRTLSSLRYRWSKIRHLEKPSPRARLKRHCRLGRESHE